MRRVSLRARCQAGLTYVELLMAIVIIAIAVSGIMLVYSETVARSADPAIRIQATAIANAYLEEIMSKQFSDPDGTSPEPESSRALYDDVGDYASLSPNPGPPATPSGASIGLPNYSVAVRVSQSTALGPAAMRVPGSCAWLITVTVTPPVGGGGSITVSGYRTSYSPC